jgi:uncharacterized protein
MPVNPTYPGIYIEELPNSTHTITAAPTSVTVFIGYTHPYKTQTFKEAIEIFSFTDYQRLFGGLFSNAMISNDVPNAVQQFFLNGGSVAYVVGLEPTLLTVPEPNALPVVTPFPSPAATVGNILFTGLEPIDAVHVMTVTVTRVTSSSPANANDTADIVVSYGSQVESFRKVQLSGTAASNTSFIENRLNGVSSLVTVSLAGTATSYGSFPAGTTTTTFSYPPSATSPPPQPQSYVFSVDDFTDPSTGVFVADGSLDKLSIFNLMVIPGVTDYGIWSEAMAFCEAKRAFLIMDPPPNFSADGMSPLSPTADGMKNPLPAIETVIESPNVTFPTSANAALYYPYLDSLDTVTGNPIRLPPSGFVAGVFSNTDATRGVWKAPAGLAAMINNTTGVVPEGRLTDARAGVLNPLGVNCIRNFAGIGTVIFGARTTVTQNPALQQWRYVPVRRTALFIEQTLYGSLGWAVFEPNDTPLWTALRTTVEAFMLTLFHQGAFQGATPSDAFLVKCDSSTTTQTDINNGIVNILVAFAPLIPAEFVVIQIAQLAGQAQSS